MSQSNLVTDEVTTPLLPRNNHPNLHFLRNYSYDFINETISIGKISCPLVFLSICLYARSFVSMYYLGGLGDKTLAGGSLAIALANITGYSLFPGLTMGVETICSQAFGARRYNYVHATVKRGIILLLVSSLPIILAWIYMKKISIMLNQNKDLESEAHIFLLWSIPDLIAQSFLHPLQVYLRIQSKTLPLFICTAIANILYLPITSLFVTYLDLGIKGIALSNVVSNFNLVVFIFLYRYFFKENISVEEDEDIYEETYEDSVREWKKLLGLVIPNCFSVCIEWWCYEIFMLLCGKLEHPKVSIASMGIIMQITSLVYKFPHSLSSGVSTRVGNELGSNLPQNAKRAAIVGLGLGIALGFLSLTFTVSFKDKWATYFTDDKYIIALTAEALPFVGFCELGNCLQTAGCGILRGSARPRIGATINGIAFYAVGIPVGLVMAFCFGFGFNGFWIGMITAQTTCAIFMMVVICRTDWELEARRANELTAVVDSGNNNCEENVEARLVDQVVVN
ncbi:unnamed protein product [Arabidopsis arenosa]|uniref:Protein DETOXIFICATION n=1 Tax=Arabidopsis arenosa TaxID=38785 RepID=A0A8S2B3Z9_ARAAE|nr:unnamed protein product [Arabidopsis arenosa]